ncbi:MarR family winged helix-turn-helix transcriptional regulator [Streptomyces sp. NPDC016309]|uniref:MarR family winged helix-turn-helix transcriptional regulator n=1 Tax=Streptomyces sp. NPDC016309 TaxID=3364965 RepID=UPI0036FC2834
MTSEFDRIAHDFAQTYGLHPTDVQALILILDGAAPDPLDGTSARPPVTPGVLREHLRLTSGAVTACLDRLEKAGHIRRVREATDRRVVHLRYEPRGREVARAFFAPLARATDAARGRFSDEELHTVVRFLAAMNSELTRVRESGPL